ncbi:MAG: ABC transporter substrate-binding protein [Rhodospirillales bacterium]|nr:ABC transporter substrate-binding protein [Rhodospirillales bacterium]MCB9996140.1 ABC transporter substrate-binding protein [Rhodospirillales bacterium]
MVLGLAGCVTFALPQATNAFPVMAVPVVLDSGMSASVIAVNGGTVDDKVAKAAQGFIDGMGQKAIGFLGDSGMSIAQKKSSFRKLLQGSFDMKTIGRFSLGRYWRVATPEQRKEYLTLFENMVIEVYSQRFSDYQGQKFETRSYRADGPSDTLVTSFIVPDSGPEIQVDWRVRYKNGKYRVIDVIVEGVSMSVTQRSDFSAVIQRGGGDVQVLLDHLRGA